MFKHDLPELVEDASASASRPAFDQLSPRTHLLILLLLTALIYVGSAWNPSLQDDADAAHAEAAREIVERGDWVTLHINGVRYLEKAPLMYWAVALSYKVFGFNEFATRLPLAIGAMLLVAAVYYFGRWMGGARAGFYSGLAMSTGLGVYLFTRVMIPEVIIAFFLTVAFYFFLKVYLGELDTRWVYVFYACMAAAVLTKGLIGLVFPCGALFVFMLMTNGWRQLWKMRPIKGSLLFLAIAVPWHALAIWSNEKFFWFYFINEHVLRYLGKRLPGRLRHGSDRLVLAAASGLALPVQRLSAPGPGAAARPVAAHGARRSVAALCLVVGAGGDRLLLLLHPPGVLHLPRVSGAGSIGRRGPGARREGEIALGMRRDRGCSLLWASSWAPR